MSKRVAKKRPCLSSTVIVLVFFFFFCSCVQLLEAACEPQNGCSTALVAYRVQSGDKLDIVTARFQTTIDVAKFYNDIQDSNFISVGQSLRFPFPCGCVNDQLEHSFTYIVQAGDNIIDIANVVFEGLSTVDSIKQANGNLTIDKIYPGQNLQVPVQCFCGNPSVDPDFGLFTTYLAVSTDSISALGNTFKTDPTLIQLFNPLVDFNGSSLAGHTLFIPSTNGRNGTYPAFQSSGGNGTYPAFQSSGGVSSSNTVLIVCVSVLGVVVLFLFILVLCLWYALFSRRIQATKVDHHGEAGLVPIPSLSRMRKFSEALRSGRSGMLKFAGDSESLSGPLASGSLGSGPLGSGPLRSGPLGPSRPSAGRSALSGFTLDKSVEFSFEELAAATKNFSVANKIGEGGYGSVYLAILRGQKTAVKRMNVQATREFLSELQILTHVHHTHLVQLIGYCTVDSLFLIYEFVENGPLEQHLHCRNGLPPLSWTARVQIALDSARGLEYIHEHTKPTYIHRDVKTSNILLDKRLRAKVADFGLTKLTETGFSSVSISMSNPMRLVGTFGYMSPEYARYGDVSPKVDVYSFGVVLFEIISAKSAIVKTMDFSGDPKIPDKEGQRSLVGLFEQVMKDPHGQEALRGLVDPALSDYPLESAWKMAELAADCTQDNPELRPSMRTIVVELMTLSSTTNQWDIGSFGRGAVIPGLMSGR